MNEDLETAVRFVIERIAEEAELSGTPLESADRRLLQHLPTAPRNPTAYHDGYPELCSTPVLRDFQFERLCRLAKRARLKDIEMDRQFAGRWEFATAVLQLNHHPMSWLLGWGDAKTARPSWDLTLLLATGLIIVVSAILIAIGLASVAEGKAEIWKRAAWIVGISAFATVMFVVYFATRRLEDWQLRRTIEKRRGETNLAG